MSKTRKNENKTRRFLPPCDPLHPVTIRFYEGDPNEEFDPEYVTFVTFIDNDDMTEYCKQYPNYRIVETGHNRQGGYICQRKQIVL